LVCGARGRALGDDLDDGRGGEAALEGVFGGACDLVEDGEGALKKARQDRAVHEFRGEQKVGGQCGDHGVFPLSVSGVDGRLQARCGRAITLTNYDLCRQYPGADGKQSKTEQI
jgi:hypothetical protein